MNKHTRTELVLNDDPRLVAAVGSVVEHAVNRAGLPEEVQKQLAETAVERRWPISFAVRSAAWTT